MISTEKTRQFSAVSRMYSDASILMHAAIAHKVGLSDTDHKYLGLIIQQGEMTAGELARLTGLTTGAVTGLIDRLEKKRLVKRQFTKDDRRKVLIIPNQKNTMKLLQPVFKELQEKTHALIASFTQKEIEIIERYFISAITIMDETRNKLNTK